MIYLNNPRGIYQYSSVAILHLTTCDCSRQQLSSQMLTVPTCTNTQGERYQETMKLVLSMFYALLSPDNHLSLTRNTNSVTSKSSIVCCSSKLLCSGCCQHRISTQRNRDYLYWPHSKWRLVGYHSYFKEGVVLERVYNS